MKQEVISKIKATIIQHSHLKNQPIFNDVLDTHEHSFCVYSNSKYPNFYFVISKEEVFGFKAQVRTKLNLYTFNADGGDVDFDASGINLNDFAKESIKHCELI